MRMPPESSSSWVVISFASFTWSSLNAWSKFTALRKDDRDFLSTQASSLRSSIESLVKEARETQDQLIFGRPEAQASQNAWLVLIGRTVSEALDIVKIKLGNSSVDHPLVREFLPDLRGGISRKKIVDRPDAVKEAADRLSKLQGDFSDKAELVARLQQAAEGAQKAVDANTSAWSAWSKERSEEIVAKGRLRLDLERTYKALGAQFPGQKEFVESFFLKGDKPSEGGGEGDDSAESDQGKG
jgi:hypothetical protein